MKKLKASVTFLVGTELTRLEISDELSGAEIVHVDITPGELIRLLSRQANVKCGMQLFDVNSLKWGKKQEHATHEFEIPFEPWRQDKEELHLLCKLTCPDGWEPDYYFSSQNSFFTKDGKNFARTIIRRWVNP